MQPYYEADGITIYHGDCREILPLVEADVLVTDPPYGIAWKRGVNNARNSKAHAGIINDHDTSVRDSVMAVWPGPSVVFGSFYARFPYGVKQVLVWRKPTDAGVVGSVTGFRRDAEPVFLCGEWPQRTVQWSSVLGPGAPGIAATAAQTGHPHTKPVALMRFLINACPPGTILDPFMGSGTTLRAAKDLGRKAIGIEIEEKYCEIAAQRLGQMVLDLEDAA
jgi:DNA modification methylase